MAKELDLDTSMLIPDLPIDPRIDWNSRIDPVIDPAGNCMRDISWIDPVIDPACYCGRDDNLDRSADRSRLINRSSDRSQGSLFATEMAGSIGWSIQRPTVRGADCPIDQLIDWKPSNRSADRFEFLISCQRSDFSTVSCLNHITSTKMTKKHSNDNN